VNAGRSAITREVASLIWFKAAAPRRYAVLEPRAPLPELRTIDDDKLVKQLKGAKT
jgi:hypothetical protein